MSESGIATSLKRDIAAAQSSGGGSLVRNDARGWNMCIRLRRDQLHVRPLNAKLGSFSRRPCAFSTSSARPYLPHTINTNRCTSCASTTWAAPKLFYHTIDHNSSRSSYTHGGVLADLISIRILAQHHAVEEGDAVFRRRNNTTSPTSWTWPPASWFSIGTHTFTSYKHAPSACNHR